MTVAIRVGDCRELLRSMPAESVQCVVTSPPYWGLRAYTGGDGMLGLEPTFDEHLANLVEVFREVRRVLRADGTCWLNYGDAYASSGLTGRADNGKQTWSGGPINSGPRVRKPDHCLKPKDLMMMPARVAIALQADGWWVRSEVVWHKPNPMPESATDRPTSSHEKLFLLAKSGASLFWTHRGIHGVRSRPEPDYVWRNRDTSEETDVEPSGWRTLLSELDPKQKLWRRVNLWDGHDYFYDAEAVRVPQSTGTIERFGNGRAQRKMSVKHGDQKDGDSFPEELQPDGRANLRNVWTIATHSFSDAHFATFPPKLVEPCILAGTSGARMLLRVRGAVGAGGGHRLQTEPYPRNRIIERSTWWDRHRRQGPTRCPASKQDRNYGGLEPVVRVRSRHQAVRRA